MAKRLTLLQEASSPDTDFQRLKQLADKRNEDVCRAVALNPSSLQPFADSTGYNFEILLKLSWGFPNEVMSNTTLLMAIYDAAGSQEPWVSKLSDLIVFSIRGDNVSDETRRLALLSDLKPVKQELMYRPEFQKHLVNDPDQSIREDLAKHSSATEETLDKLSSDTSVVARIYVTMNPMTSAAILRTMAQDPDEEVRSYVAKNTKTPPDVLDRLANEQSEDVVEPVIRNPSCPVDTLRRLSRHESWSIRFTVANFAKGPKDVLLHLAEDENTTVVSGLLSNTNADWEVIRKVTRHPNQAMAARAEGLMQKLFPAYKFKLFLLMADDGGWWSFRSSPWVGERR